MLNAANISLIFDSTKLLGIFFDGKEGEEAIGDGGEGEPSKMAVEKVERVKKGGEGGSHGRLRRGTRRRQPYIAATGNKKIIAGIEGEDRGAIGCYSIML